MRAEADDRAGCPSLNEGDQIADQFGPGGFMGGSRNFREPNGPSLRTVSALLVRVGAPTDLAVAGNGVIHLFEDC